MSVETHTYCLNTYEIVNIDTEAFYDIRMLYREVWPNMALSVLTAVCRDRHTSGCCILHCFRKHRIMYWAKSQLVFVGFEYFQQNMAVKCCSVHCTCLNSPYFKWHFPKATQLSHYTDYLSMEEGGPSETSVTYTNLKDVMTPVIKGTDRILFFVLKGLVL
jgi:hypothetical protein